MAKKGTLKEDTYKVWIVEAPKTQNRGVEAGSPPKGMEREIMMKVSTLCLVYHNGSSRGRSTPAKPLAGTSTCRKATVEKNSLGT